MKSKFIYSLPIQKNDFNLAVSDPRVHFGKTLHAVDFLLKIGTPILASQKGKIVEIYTESNEGGFNDKYLQNINKYTNRITIKHAENEYTQYAHLAHKSEKVKVGQEVAKGHVIALSGNTGYTSQPHLHFHVMQLLEEGKDWESIEIKWDENFNIVGKNNL
jgi:murein DD-endopeptidase MepM/ murein hydrolase activator NlpD